MEKSSKIALYLKRSHESQCRVQVSTVKCQVSVQPFTCTNSEQKARERQRMTDSSLIELTSPFGYDTTIERVTKNRNAPETNGNVCNLWNLISLKMSSYFREDLERLRVDLGYQRWSELRHRYSALGNATIDAFRSRSEGHRKWGAPFRP